MTRKKATPSLRSGKLAGHTLAVALLVSAGTLSLPQSAMAASCSTIPSCKAGSTVASKFATTTVSVAMTTFQYLITEYMILIKDAFTRLANQSSNNVQNADKTEGSFSDGVLSSITSTTTTDARIDGMFEMMPSRTTCVTVSNTVKLADAQYNVNRITNYNASQHTATNYASNAPGSPTERGALQASVSAFKDFTDGFCDPAVINPPTGVSCTLVNDSAGKPMAFRFTQPYQAVFGVPNGTIPPDPTNPENRAARLFARMAIEPVPTDPLRGQVLVREDGKNAFIARQGDIAVVNLARGAIDHQVDDRIGELVAGSESLEFLRQRAWSDASGMAKDAIDRAAQPISANMDDIALMITDINKIYLQIYNNLERLAAIKATHLARVISEQAAGNSGLASRSVNH